MKKLIPGIISIAMTIILASCSSVPIQRILSGQDFGTNGADYATDVAAPRSGVGAVVVGETNGSLEGLNKGDYDAFIRKYDGAPVWASQYGTPALDYATDVTITSSGISYVLGQTTGVLGLKVGGQDVYLRKYSSSGAVLWTRQFGTTGTDSSVDVTLDNSGNIYALSIDSNANLRVRKYSPAGALLMTISNNASVTPSALAVDSAGNIFVLTRYVTTATFARMFKFSSAGTLLGTTNFFSSPGPNSLYICDLVIDSSDTLYASLYSFATDKGGHLFKLTTSLSKTWTRRLEPASTGKASTPQALALDSAGNIYVAGSTTGSYAGFTNAGQYDIFAMKYSPSGTRLWTRQFGASGNDYGLGIAVSDAVYVAGYSNSNPNLLGDAGYGGDDALLAQLNSNIGDILGIDQ